MVEGRNCLMTLPRRPGTWDGAGEEIEKKNRRFSRSPIRPEGPVPSAAPPGQRTVGGESGSCRHVSSRTSARMAAAKYQIAQGNGEII